MSIDIESHLMLVPSGINVYEKLCNMYPNADDYCWLLGDLGLNYSSPRYDCPDRNLIVGVYITRPTYENIINPESDWRNDLTKGYDKLMRLFGNSVIIKLEDVVDIY